MDAGTHTASQAACGTYIHEVFDFVVYLSRGHLRTPETILLPKLLAVHTTYILKYAVSNLLSFLWGRSFALSIKWVAIAESKEAPPAFDFGR